MILISIAITMYIQFYLINTSSHYSSSTTQIQYDASDLVFECRFKSDC